MIVLDTHALVWWVNEDGKLSARARREIAKEQRGTGRILVSAISAWEIAMLLKKGRLRLTMEFDEWLSAVAGIEGVQMVSVSPHIAVQSVHLPGDFHPDPADRMIVALAREMNAPVITADTRIQAYPHVRWIW